MCFGMHLAQTKFHQPLVTETSFYRGRLVRGVLAPLTVIHAPTGFGKTTLAAQMVAEHANRTAWLSLDETDKDPKRFWYAVLSALNLRFPSVGKQSRFVLDQAESALQDVTGCLINELLAQTSGVESPHVLVLDDFHHMTSPESLATFNLFLDHLPPQWHVVITTRNLPALKLAQRKSKERANEVSAQELRFTKPECLAFFQGFDCTFSQSEIESISMRCEGWAAALRLYGLAGISAKRQLGLGHADQDLYEVLMAEVMADLPQEIRQFLSHTAFLPRFCARLANVTLGINNSANLIADLLHRNLFTVALDGHLGWHRYHDLFRSFLLERFRLPEQELNNLKVRAAHWHAAEGQHGEALHFYLDARDWAHASRVLSERGRVWIKQGQGELVRQALDAMPESVLANQASLLCLKVWNATDTEKYEHGRCWLDQAKQILDRATEPASDTAQLRYELLTLCAIVERLHERWELTLRYSQAALDAAKAVKSPMKWRPMLTLGAHAYLQGDLQQAQQLLEDAVHWSLEDGNSYGAAQSCGYLSEVLYQRGELQKAIRLVTHVRQTLEERGFSGANKLGAWRWIGEVDLQREMGEFEQAHLGLNELKQLRDADHCEALQHLIILLRAYALAISQNLPAEARRLLAQIELVQSKMRFKSVFATGSLEGMYAEVAWLEGDTVKCSHWLTVQLTQQDDFTFVRLRDRFTTVRILFALKRFEQAIDLAERIRQAAVQRGHVLAEAMALMWSAASTHATGQLDAANQSLLAAFQQISGQGYRRVFLDQGDGLAPVLKLCAGDAVFGELAKSLLKDLKHQTPKVAAQAPLPRPAAVQSAKLPLSQRELDLLIHVRDGLSDKEIAKLANISPGTVKTHLRNIYRKLEVNGRVQALTKLNWLHAPSAVSSPPF